VRKYSLFVTFLSTVERFFYATVLANHDYCCHYLVGSGAGVGHYASGAWAIPITHTALNVVGSDARLDTDLAPLATAHTNRYTNAR
jgi:hypothetical protein